MATNPKVVVSCICAAVLLGSVALVLFVHPLYGDPQNFADAQHQCVQSEDSSCAAAAIVSALSYRNIRISEHTAAAAAGTTRYGTFITVAAQAVQKMLGDHYTVTVIKQLPDPSLGELLLVEINDNYPVYHMVCADGTGTGWVVNDPLKHAPEAWTAADMQKSFATVDAQHPLAAIEIHP